jgi:hypothetical protein
MGTRPEFTASRTDASAASVTGDISRTSAPASSARTATSPGGKPFATPPISSASVITSPWKWSWSRSTPVSTRSESVAGMSGFGSSAGTARWPVMIASTPALMAALKGTNSTAFSRSSPAVTSGSCRCESTEVSPCPGKCFAVAMAPFSSTPRTNCATYSATCFGSSPNERILMMGLSGLLFTSATGANTQCTPMARASMAVMRPIA